MRRTLKLLLLLGIGLALAKNKDGDGITPGDSDNTIDPTTGRPKTDEQRKKDSTYDGKNAQKDFKGVLDDADNESQAGRGADGQDGNGTSESDPDSTETTPPRDSDLDRIQERLDNQKEHLTYKDLDAARRELNGEVVATKSDGTPWDHVHEVRDAQNGLMNIIERANRKLDDSRVSEADKAEYEAILAEASRLLDYSEGFVPRS